ncbi:E3 ubiquitin/ISG15 ligase TRIM25-like [Microcaecilia unicolor]|uniref:E3 ubiquitin/ISG15 ligase TRIM25-like n=1 Tax=Microcaecilia unicolor TaxID=1415580 RepID=A0A6P7YAI8_9AMPH|nr:E3 ubiquitin/ISG15 ligase TRIM25-like [Microcaecilia unicolor]
MGNTHSYCLEENILCAICLEVFRNPVTIGCGHTFCIECLQVYWDYQADYALTPCCPQCREIHTSRPRLCKNTVLADLVECFMQYKEGTTGTALPDLAGPGDIPCDACTSDKQKSAKFCLQCMASFCEPHLRPHYENPVFKRHKLLEAVTDFQVSLCQKHNRMQELFCRKDGLCICYACALENHRDHEVVPVEEERIQKEAEVRRLQASIQNQLLLISDEQDIRFSMASIKRLVQNVKNEVRFNFEELMQDLVQLQEKVMNFLEHEEWAAVARLGDCCQQREFKIIELQQRHMQLNSCMGESSDLRFLQDFQTLKRQVLSAQPLVSLRCDESASFTGFSETLAVMKSQIATTSNFYTKELLREGLVLRPHEVLPPGLEREMLMQWYVNLCFDGRSASGELLLCQENNCVVNMGILLESSSSPPIEGFNYWPQVLCIQGLCQGRFYWEVEVTDSWLCLGLTYRYPPAVTCHNISYLIGRNNHSWCLEWDSLQFSVWHNNIQTYLKGEYYRIIGVYVDTEAGYLTFYGVSDTVNIIFHFPTRFKQPLYPAFMVSAEASITLSQLPE